VCVSQQGVLIKTPPAVPVCLPLVLAISKVNL